jgi:hypothetical protein
LSTNRIPDRGTPRYRTYWAERRMLDELREMEGWLAAMATDPHVYGNIDKYSEARALLMQAVEAFDEAWRMGMA